MGGFGNGTANLPIDYAIQSYNYTGELNSCQVGQTQLALRAHLLMIHTGVLY